ncbi:tetratricopeptide repeat protein, partial [Maribacter sp.]|nr:tetratricopeptide repeat protein [Maribacter sp.]
MKKRILLLLFFILVFSGFSQTAKIDSLKGELTKSISDSVRAKILNDISYYYLFQNIDSTISFGKKVIALAKNKPKLQKDLVISYMNIGNGFSFKNQFDSAQIYINKSLQMADKFPKTKSSAYVALGIMHRRKGQFNKSLEAYLEGVQIDEKLDYKYGMFGKYSNIANVYYEMSEYDKSIEYNERALALSEQSEDKRIALVTGKALSNIAQSYQRKGDFNRSLDYLNKAVEQNLANQNKSGLAKDYINIANIYSQINQLKLGITYALKALKLSQEFGDSYDLIDVNKSLGVLYGKRKEENKSKFYFDKALSIALESENLSYLSEIYLDMSNYFHDSGNSRKALDFH